MNSTIFEIAALLGIVGFALFMKYVVFRLIANYQIKVAKQSAQIHTNEPTPEQQEKKQNKFKQSKQYDEVEQFYYDGARQLLKDHGFGGIGQFLAQEGIPENGLRIDRKRFIDILADATNDYHAIITNTPFNYKHVEAKPIEPAYEYPKPYAESKTLLGFKDIYSENSIIMPYSAQDYIEMIHDLINNSPGFVERIKDLRLNQKLKYSEIAKHTFEKPPCPTTIGFYICQIVQHYLGDEANPNW